MFSRTTQSPLLARVHLYYKMDLAIATCSDSGSMTLISNYSVEQMVGKFLTSYGYLD